eukprot:GFKZ01004836.1.p2 GENE.GFKZ01004836.1~~GFKZ01004836.1.p2  ORF type:complete len:128 (-),score=0.66 GFKZ01004836.1:448-831(-)
MRGEVSGHMRDFSLETSTSGWSDVAAEVLNRAPRFLTHRADDVEGRGAHIDAFGCAEALAVTILSFLSSVECGCAGLRAAAVRRGVRADDSHIDPLGLGCKGGIISHQIEGSPFGGFRVHVGSEHIL